MSEEKEMPILPGAPEEKLLPQAERPLELTAPDEYLELTAPEATSLLESGEELLEVKKSDSVDPVPTQMLGDPQESIDMSDPAIFDTTGADVPKTDSVNNNPDSDRILDFVLEPIPQEKVEDREAVQLTPQVIEQTHISHLPPVSMAVPSEGVVGVPKKSHTFLWIFVGILVLGLIAGGAWYILSQGSDSKSSDIVYTISSEVTAPTYSDTLQNNIEIEEQDIQNLNRALTDNDMSVCESIQGPSRKTECQETLMARSITSTGTTQDCQELTLPDIRTSCISVLVQSGALATLDPTHCSQIESTSQAHSCVELVDQKILASLIQNNAATTDTCNKLINPYKSQCLESIKQIDDSAVLQKAVSEENLEVCKSLSSEELQFTCFDTILLKQALKSGDKNLCDYVRDEGKKNTCLSYMTKKDDNAVFKSAVVDKDLRMCQDITVESLRNRCHDSVTLLLVRDTRDAKLCDTLIATGSIASCKTSVQSN